MYNYSEFVRLITNNSPFGGGGLELKIARIACGGDVMPGDVIVMKNFTIFGSETASTIRAAKRCIVLGQLLWVKIFHDFVIRKNFVYFPAFVQNVLKKFIHNIWTTVNKRFSAVLGQVRDPVAAKARWYVFTQNI